MRPALKVLFHGREPHCEEIPDQGVRATCFRVGETSVEFLESTRDEGPIGKYLAKRGSGIHHLAIHVEDIEGALAELKEAGIPLVDEKPRLGAEGKKIAFLHPKGTGGILIELCEG
ncbi:MAG: methylmalonyl-CoA epimerase [Candidatus Eisenbacteria bacterium]|nr:methylmalonyl-CoA epimerase [Candidatus Eisenbacteria bacterium]